MPDQWNITEIGHVMSILEVENKYLYDWYVVNIPPTLNNDGNLQRNICCATGYKQMLPLLLDLCIAMQQSSTARTFFNNITWAYSFYRQLNHDSVYFERGWSG